MINGMNEEIYLSQSRLLTSNHSFLYFLINSHNANLVLCLNAYSAIPNTSPFKLRTCQSQRIGLGVSYSLSEDIAEEGHFLRQVDQPQEGLKFQIPEDFADFHRRLFRLELQA